MDQSSSLEIYNKPKLPNIVIRSGVIPYAHKNGKTYWLLGINHHNHYADFGGGCHVRKGETAYQCLIRETQEEAGQEIRQLVDESLKINEGIYVYHQTARKNKHIHTYMILAPIPYDEVRGIEPNNEVLRIEWHDQAEILNNKRKYPDGKFQETIRWFIRLLR